jgi:hypothetical protein
MFPGPLRVAFSRLSSELGVKGHPTQGSYYIKLLPVVLHYISYWPIVKALVTGP